MINSVETILREKIIFEKITHVQVSAGWGSYYFFSILIRPAAITCNALPSIPNGSIRSNQSPLVPGSTAFVICNEGYKLQGTSTTTCLASLTWTTTPTCSRKDPNYITKILIQKSKLPSLVSVTSLSSWVQESWNSKISTIRVIPMDDLTQVNESV